MKQKRPLTFCNITEGTKQKGTTDLPAPGENPRGHQNRPRYPHPRHKHLWNARFGQHIRHLAQETMALISCMFEHSTSSVENSGKNSGRQRLHRGHVGTAVQQWTPHPTPRCPSLSSPGLRGKTRRGWAPSPTSPDWRRRVVSTASAQVPASSTASAGLQAARHSTASVPRGPACGVRASKCAARPALQRRCPTGA